MVTDARTRDTPSPRPLEPALLAPVADEAARLQRHAVKDAARETVLSRPPV